MNKAASEAGRIPAASPMNIYDFCSLLNYAYIRSLVAPEIMSAFAAAGVWPLDRQKVLGIARPRSSDDVRTIVGVDELDRMYLEKFKVARKRILGEKVVNVRKGFVSTTKGEVFTSKSALDAARAQTAIWRAKQEADREKEAKKRRKDGAKAMLTLTKS